MGLSELDKIYFFGCYKCIAIVSIFFIFLSACKNKKNRNDNSSSDIYELNTFEGDDGYQLFLTYGPLMNTYEFVTCDSSVEVLDEEPCDPIYENSISGEGLAAKILENENFKPSCDPIGTRPAHCVGAFRSDKIGNICKIYPFYYSNCTLERLAELENFCLNPTSVAVPADWNVNSCNDLSYLKNNCDIVLHNLNNICHPLYESQKECDAEKADPASISCSLVKETTNTRVAFLLEDLSMVEEQQRSVLQQLSYEKYLSVKNDPTKVRIQSFGTGASTAAFWGTFDILVKKLMPQFIKNIGTNIPFINKRLTAAPFVGFTAEVAISEVVNPYEFRFLMDSVGYSPTGRCIQSKITIAGEHVAPFETDQQLHETFKDTILPTVAGFGSNMLILKGVNHLHKFANKIPNQFTQVGSMLVLPFITHVISNRLSDNSSDILSREMQSLLTPVERNNPNNANGFKQVASVKKIAPVLGRMMIFGGKAAYFNLNQFCLPKKNSLGKYEQECSDIFEGNERYLYDISTGKKEYYHGDPCDFEAIKQHYAN